MTKSRILRFRQNQVVIDIPGYRIKEPLGKGGMASVYLAIQESFEREVALKVMDPNLSEDAKFSQRFVREAKIVARLVHPNIVTVYDVGVHNHQHYLSMEYIPGQDLKHKRKQLRIRDSLTIIRDVAKALDYASKKGYVHRDVKPENIMLHEEDGRAVLMDFGIACLADTTSGMTQTGTAIGTPHYMSPEQAKGKAVDSRSDIYSLGVVLYLLLTGYLPYDAESAVAVGIKHVSEAIPRLPKMLWVLQPIIDKVLAKEPADRYQSGAELVAALGAIDLPAIKAIELLRARATNIPGEEPTYTASSLSQAQAAVEKTGSGKQVSTTGAQARAKTTSGYTIENLKTPSGRIPANQRNASTGQQPTGQQQKVAKISGSQAAVDPVKTTSKTEIKTTTQSNRVATTEKEKIATTNTQALPRQTTQAIYIDDEDRRDHQRLVPRKRVWPWMLAAVVLLLVGGVYFRALLPAPVAGALQIVEVGNTAVPSAPVSASQPPTSVQAGKPVAAPSPVAVAENIEEVASNSVAAQLAQDLSVAAQLAQAYRDTLATTPGDKAAELGLNEIREYHELKLKESLAARDIAAAQIFIASMDASFPGELADDQKYQALRKQLENAQRAQVYIDKAEDYIARDELTEPRGANAMASFQQALIVDPNNPLAIAGLKQIVDRYVELANASIDTGEWEQALRHARRGLAIDKTNADLIQIQDQSTQQVERLDNVAMLLKAAQDQLQAGNLIEPQGDSAYDRYQKLLQYDNNSDARAGLREVEQQLAYNIEALINQNQFKEANTLIARFSQLYPGSNRTEPLNRQLAVQKEADYLARQPKIPQLVISGTRPESLDLQQQAPLTVDRTLYILFSYANFVDQNSVVQAVLYDDQQSIQIAQVPVVVSGKAGEKMFQIDRPVDRFTAGVYTIDLIVNDSTLRSTEFRVGNQ